ncbi:GT4 family glycosyltransferase PelF [Tumebacillus permanentifrigoris]|uniref:Glycosyltransferase involved in cell wall biosynthesis n=1 Tax=Tumebacillus permanentifrigoris TaxID=378543 RepID=A0A316DBI7_9BACL|nr:GT4 family glycosyltransferase PelF [Tumebacillus permanentifrigoris]PWK14965.1 glycosyltransferase involved in cell wall biosynthesis [Tumebacillus permanentifrigoris]
MSDRIKILLSTEGTYPFHQGGVSTWCETLVNKMDMVDFVIYSITANPFITQKFGLPEHAEMHTVPLWGTEEPKEHLNIPFKQIYLPKKSTSDGTVRERFIPLFVELIDEIVSEVKNPRRFGNLLVELYNYFQEHDYKLSFKSEATWEIYKELILRLAADKRHRLSEPDVYGLVQSLGWVYRFLNIVNTPIPDTHVTHSTAAAFCGIPCVIAKIRNKTPFMLTEHGVYLREQYLALSKRPYSSFLTTFLIRFVKSLTTTNYAFADQVSPVCEYNTRWETRFGVPVDRVKVIYNGIDPNVFVEAPPSTNEVLTVVMVARIDPLKDVLTFLQAAALVRDAFPAVKFVVYGSVSVQGYYDQCIELWEQLHLQDTFIFAGHTSNMAAAYHSGDIIALTSISEAFPYSVIEAMMTGKPVVATDVGGVTEALGDAGLIATPRKPEEVAAGILKLLNNAELRDMLGKEARQRALNFFTLNKMIDLHLKSYVKLAVRAEERMPILRRVDTLAAQKLLLDKGMALMTCQLYREAIAQFRAALKERPNSPYTPVILTELSKAHNHLGEYDEAFQELEKVTAILQVLDRGAREIA